MQYRRIPGAEIDVSLLGFGNFTFGTNWWGDFDDDEGVRLQNRAIELGVNFFDTAPAYGNGRAESLLRRSLEDTRSLRRRDELVISTKFGYDLHHDPGSAGGHRERRQDFSPAAIRAELETSLRRLGVERIDLYQAHNLKLPQHVEQFVGVMRQLRDEGKIRAWGVALGPAIGWLEEGVTALRDWGADAVQTVFNLYEQDPGRAFCQLSERLGRGGVIARVPTNSGILDEEFTSPDHQFPSWDHRKFRDRNWLIYGLEKNRVVRRYAAREGVTLPQFALKWLASFPTLVSIEPNLTSIAQLEHYAEACDGAALSEATLRDLDALYAVDFYLGEPAHPCMLKSSTSPTGRVRSAPVLV